MGKASDNKLSFTKTVLQNLPVPDKQTYYWDTKVEGLGIGVTPKNVKSFVLYQRINGKPTGWAEKPGCREPGHAHAGR